MIASVLALAALPGTASAAGVYFVKEGDTLFRISRTFNVDVERLRRVNGLRTDELKPGDRIRIPDPVAAVRPAESPAPVPLLTITPSADDAVPAPLPEAPVSPAPAPALRAKVDRLLCREERVYHRIAKGDTLTAVSRRYGVPLEDLFSLNGLGKRSRLSIGQKVLVRRSGPRTHVVRRGETLSRIAARTGVALADLRHLNGDLGDRLPVGTRLLLESCDRVDLARSTAPLFPAAPDAATGESDSVDRLVGFAKELLGIPYRFGGNTLRGIDCSAYVQRIYGQLELPLPRTAREQFVVGERVDREGLSAGDLVFFRTYAPYASHVGIYLGGERFIHASSFSRKVTIDSLDRPYYRKRFLGARRIIPATDDRVASAPR